MAMSNVTFLHRVVVRREFPCCVMVLSHGSRVFGFPAPATSHCRSVHSSPGLSAKSYLHKFTKDKKRKWYDSAWTLRTENKPPALLALMKQKQAERSGNNIRIKVLNGILYNALTGLLSTPEVSEEVYNLCIELSKVSICADFSVCRAYWLSSDNIDTDAQIDKVLQKYAPQFRHHLISHHVLGNVPTIVFVRDKEDAKRREMEKLFALLKFEEDKVSPDKISSEETNVSRKLDTETSTSLLPSIFDIDHAALNQEILAYKKKMKGKVTETDSNEHYQQQQEQLAAIRKQKFQKKKIVKGYAYDISPQDYQLLNAMDSDRPEELDFELHEDLVELDEEENEPNEANTEK